MKIVSNEVKLAYVDKIGKEGINRYYKKEKKEGLYKKMGYILFLLFCITGILFYQYKNLLLIPASCVVFSAGFFIASEFCGTFYSVHSVFMSEIINKNNFDYITVTIGLNDQLEKYFLLKFFDKDNCLLDNVDIAFPVDYTFSDEGDPFLIIDKHDWKLYFPQKELKSLE